MTTGEKMYSQTKAEGTNSYYIDGLWLYGADWIEDEQTIVDLPKFAPNGQSLPMIHLMVEQQNLDDDSQESAKEEEDGNEKHENRIVPDYLSNEEY
mmetsp:Transcript_40420/g.52992  ORF Transcript_40420/g.52992 Transcript_40420/m.52992 type:complete len:96 (+) Transcript_40420:2290-2577(+)|eukprot:CAMPEP_0185619180 /NCGR_PEP_ID=MMETSP0436-20130131/49685_1 /TAXON_ID=626734 ORGANISM="Favella taraikaensis, Strain Fe Narragansett Bay" /NCGR_SAMPLE_ID=MMETSP0436 /ASSEMBLY_ACC=CAM_ASM_000390 /LENGTH=95 /DNA_ID=CAMNT_0028258407 /DNA_START=770 /DNA_END=1057 /DNA_ORIENTATION=-